MFPVDRTLKHTRDSLEKKNNNNVKMITYSPSLSKISSHLESHMHTRKNCKLESLSITHTPTLIGYPTRNQALFLTLFGLKFMYKLFFSSSSLDTPKNLTLLYFYKLLTASPFRFILNLI